jgi:hypothetical protein
LARRLGVRKTTVGRARLSFGKHGAGTPFVAFCSPTFLRLRETATQFLHRKRKTVIYLLPLSDSCNGVTGGIGNGFVPIYCINTNGKNDLYRLFINAGEHKTQKYIFGG